VPTPRSRKRNVLLAAGLCCLTSCSMVMPRTTQVLQPVQDDLILAFASDLDRLVTLILGLFL
jgi:hypothetical protein